jgi:ABC-type Zn uptake system ZnuABC Zn-binding protein ZnuA
MISLKTTPLAVLSMISVLVPAVLQGGPKDQLSIVGSLTVYSDIAKEIVGERGKVASIAAARQDAHFVQAKPSYAMMVSRADLLLAT